MTEEEPITCKVIYDRYYKEYKPAQIESRKETSLQRIQKHYVSMYRDKETILDMLMIAVDNGKEHCCVFKEYESPCDDIDVYDLTTLFLTHVAPLFTRLFTQEFNLLARVKECIDTKERTLSVRLRWQTDLLAK